MCTIDDPVTTYAQMRADGLSRRRIEAELWDGSIARVRRGLYIRSEACGPVRTAAAHGGALACVSAARHRGLWVLAEPAPVHVGLHPHGRAYRHGACACIAHWAEASTPVCTPGSMVRTLCQILACRGVEEFFVALESALHERRLTGEDVQRLRRQTTAAGREALAYARSDSESGLESLVRWRLRHWGLRIRTQLAIPAVGRVDIVIGERLIVEADGSENHAGHTNRHKDLVRDANAATRGMTTLRFDYAMIVHEWGLVEAAILGAITFGLHEYP